MQFMFTPEPSWELAKCWQVVLEVGDRLGRPAFLWVSKGNFRKKRARPDVLADASLWLCVEAG